MIIPGVTAIAGAILVSLVTVLYHWLFFRSTLGDGQYGLVLYMVTVPSGLVIGFTFGYVLRNLGPAAYRTAWASIVGAIIGVLPALFLARMTALNAPTTGSTLSSAFWGACAFLLPVLLLAGALMVLGVGLLIRGAV